MVGRTTVCNLVKEVCNALWQTLSPTYLKTPETEDEWEAIAADFFEEWDLPHVLGALDGKHVAMECPKHGGSQYYNYKQFHSTVLMALCDSKYRFTYVNIGSYGRDNDASIFARTELNTSFDSGAAPIPPPSLVDGFLLPYILVGDEIFPLKTWLMKPYPGRNLSEEEAVFNYRLSRARRTIKNAFGILAARWRIFRRPIRADVETVDVIVKATLCLHNYLCLTENASYIPSGFVDSWNNDGTIKQGDWRSLSTGTVGMRPLRRVGTPNYPYDAKTTRDNFKDYVNSERGVLPWQLDLIRSCGRVLAM